MPQYPTLNENVLRDMDRAINGRLTPPENARKKTQKNNKTGLPEEHIRFNESARITSMTVTTTISGAGDEHDVYEAAFEITGTRGSGTLIGETTYLRARFNPVAWDEANKESGQFKMSRGTLIRLVQLVRACGFPVKGGLTSAQMQAYFPIDGESPLVGKEVYIEIHQNESDGSNTGWNEEVNNIYPLNVAAASAEV